MTISVTAPVERALTRTREVLFDPFDITKWFKLGFCAFLAQLGDNSGGGGGSANIGSWREPARSRQVQEAVDWFHGNWEFIVTVGAFVLLAVLAIGVAVLWLQGRGRFMFLDGVVRNRGAVVEPWSTYRAEGNSAFWFSLCFAIVGFVAVLIASGIGVGIAWTDIDAEHFGPAAWGGIVVGGGLLFLLVVTMLLIGVFLADFVIPAMYARRIGVMEGWGVVRREVLAAYPGQIVLYLLMKILISVAFAVIVTGVVCGTLCIAGCFLAIPYIGTVLMLPLLVFGRCYSLYFLDQLGGEWKLISGSKEPVEVLP